MAKTKKEDTVAKKKKNSRRNIRKIIKSVDLSELTKIREEIVRNFISLLFLLLK